MPIIRRINHTRLTWKKKLLLVITIILTGFFRFIILFFPFKVIASFMGTERLETTKCRTDEHLPKIRAISWAVSTASRNTPWKSLCMVQALTAQLLLRYFSIPATLYLGVKKNEGQLIAHAWLRSGSEIVTGGDTMDNFRAIICYGSTRGDKMRKERD
jgi:hypothetical protein